MSKKDRILHLVLKRKWFEKIKSGEKKKEYRRFCSYWNKIFDLDSLMRHDGAFPYQIVIFHNGYTNETMSFYISSIRCLYDEPNDLGEDPVWTIELGRRIK